MGRQQMIILVDIITINQLIVLFLILEYSFSEPKETNKSSPKKVHFLL